MAGRQSTSRAELSVVRLRIEGWAQADLGRVRLLGGEQQAGGTGIERPDASLDHAPLRGKRPASGAAGVGDGNSRRIAAGSPGPGVSLVTLLRQPWTFLSRHLTSGHIGSLLHFRNFLKSTGRFSTNAFRPSIASSVR